MQSVIFQVPDSVNIDELTSALSSVGILPLEKEEQNIPLEQVIAETFPGKTPAEINGIMLKTSREDARLTQTELAELVRIDKTHISAMEHGKRPISVKMAKKLGAVLGVSYHTFI